MDLQLEPLPARRTDWLDQPLARLVTLDRATLLLGLFVLLAVVTRFWDVGVRALHHDESLHAVYSFYLYDKGQYNHEALMHGPVLFHLTALGYWIFGASDATARLVPALLGIFLTWLPWQFRGWIGRRGALVASALVLISPTLLYYSRFIREDIFAITWTALIVLGMWRFLENGSRRALYGMAAAWALLFSQKELSYLMAFLFWTFLAVMLAARVLARRRRGEGLGTVRAAREWQLLVGLGALFLPLVTPVLLFAFKLHPGALGQETSIYNFANQWPLAFQVQAFGIAGALFAVGVALAWRLWDVRRFLGMAAIFWAIYALFYTTFLTNGYGFGSGLIGSLGYWIEQQEVARGEQPWFYYFALLPLYEFLPLLVAYAGIGFLPLWLRRTRAAVVPTLLPDGRERAVVEDGWALDTRRWWPLFNLWWFLGTFALLSVASEKMPWLLTHLAFPLILFAAWTLERFLEGIAWRRLFTREAWGFAALALLAGFAIVSLLWMTATGQFPFRGTEEPALRVTLRWLVTMATLAGAGWAAISVSERLGGRLARQTLALSLLALLGVATVRFALIAAYRNSDTPNEPLIFVQSSPNVTMVARDIEAISERLTGGKGLKVAYDNFSSWPFDWYLRDFPNRFFYGAEPASYADAVRNAEVVLVGWSNEEKLKPLVAGYVRHEYPMRWWFPEEYKDLTFKTTVGQDPTTGLPVPQPTAEEDESLPNVLRNLWRYAQNPTYRDDFWDFVRDRQVKQPLGGENFVVYIKPEVAALVWQQGVAVAQPAAPVEPAAPVIPAADLAAVTVALAPTQTVGGTGQLLSPKGVAVLPDGTLAVLDSGNFRVQILRPDGTLVRQFGARGAAPGQFEELWGIAAAPDGTLYVADTWNHRIQHLDAQGNVLHVWGTYADTGGQPVQPGTFWGPRGVAVDGQGNVYVTDTGNKRVEVFSADGTFLRQWGGVGAGPGQLAEPVGIAAAPDGTIWVADTWNQRLQHFSAEGEPLGQFPIGVWAGQNVTNKPYLAASADRVWVSDPEGHRLLELDTQGTILRAWGRQGTDAGAFNLPLGLAFRDGTLWAADSENHRVLGFDVAQ